MAKIEIYTKLNCPYCHQAKALLTYRKLPFQEINIDGNGNLREQMMNRSGQTTVPQIFINGKHIGGFNDLQTLDRCNGLDYF